MIFSAYNWSQLKGVEPVFAPEKKPGIWAKDHELDERKAAKAQDFCGSLAPCPSTMLYPFIHQLSSASYSPRFPEMSEFWRLSTQCVDKPVLNAGFDLHLPFALPSFPDIRGSINTSPGCSSLLKVNHCTSRKGIYGGFIVLPVLPASIL